MSKKETVELKDLKVDKEGFLEYQKTSSDIKKNHHGQKHIFD